MTPEELDNLSTHVAQISLQVEYLYKGMNTLSFQSNSLHLRIETLEALQGVETIVKLVSQICWEIEKLPASEQQTKVSIMASGLLQRLVRPPVPSPSDAAPPRGTKESEK